MKAILIEETNDHEAIGLDDRNRKLGNQVTDALRELLSDSLWRPIERLELTFERYPRGMFRLSCKFSYKAIRSGHLTVNGYYELPVGIMADTTPPNPVGIAADITDSLIRELDRQAAISQAEMHDCDRQVEEARACLTSVANEIPSM